INPEQVQPQTVEFAARIAGQYEIALNLLFVFELPGRSKGAGFAVESEEELEADVKAIVEEVVKPLIGDVGIAETIIRSGRAADQIIAVADDLNTDVIVMGAQGRTGLKHFIMGSVTEKVVHLSTRPVMTIPLR
ncbi:MAG: universal stress protein, partial [Immundisolibacteraceae bacterium]|nr:universal stress protein [Immundisolibacteraceae bacterium]